ncbi:MAG: serpin family protein [Clostridia bacterium]|nr:serpin family protein [Clostridia bacterium]
MKYTRIILISVSLALLFAIMLNFGGCAMTVRAADLMEGVSPNSIKAIDDLKGNSSDITDFAVRLFKQVNEGAKNTLLSPLSVLCALAMTANGAEGETRGQMETVLGMNVDELNLYLYSYINSLPQGEKYKLSVANSIWLKDTDGFSVNPSFLQANADYYKAQIYKSPFDKRTLRDINLWVRNQTDGMIPKIIDEIPSQALMYLINALAFEAEWLDIYETDQVFERIFTKEDGERQSVELMYSTEGKYLEDENAVGFIKYYKGSKYAFVALLPDEGITVSEYINSLNGEALSSMLANAKSRTVRAAIPKFDTDYTVEMNDILKSMGMQDAFDGKRAEFGGIGEWRDGPIYIGDVIHKTYIQVGERGTKAGAVTAVRLDGAMSQDPMEVKQVILDRPFVYMLIDCEASLPFFIGTLMDAR